MHAYAHMCTQTCIDQSWTSYVPYGTEKCGLPVKLDGDGRESTCTPLCIHVKPKLENLCSPLIVTKVPGKGFSASQLQLNLSMNAEMMNAEMMNAETEAPVVSIVPDKDTTKVRLKREFDNTFFNSADLLLTGTYQLQFKLGGDQCPIQEVNNTCTDGYEDRAGRCVEVDEKTLCQLANISKADDPSIDRLSKVEIKAESVLSIRAPPDSRLARAKIALVSKTKTFSMAEHMTLQPNKTGSYSIQIASSDGSATCTLINDVSVKCADGKEEEKQSGTCVVGCNESKVRTVSGACETPMIFASVQSDSKFVKIHKPNHDLEGVPESVPVPLEVKPSADYPVNMTYELRSGKTSLWVSFSGLTEASDYGRRGELTYNASGILDGSEPNATLVFSGTAVQNGRSTEERIIKLSALVESTPSLKYSTMTMTSEITQGNPFQLKIQARDSDDQRITADRGRFFKISVQSPSNELRIYSSIFQSGMFSVEIPRGDLSEIGKYKVWVSRVFGYNVKPLKGALSLPTREHPKAFVVSEPEGNSLGNVVAATVAAALCIGLLIVLVRRNPKKARKLLVNFISVEVNTPNSELRAHLNPSIQLQALIIGQICFNGLDFGTVSQDWINDIACGVRCTMQCNRRAWSCQVPRSHR